VLKQTDTKPRYYYALLTLSFLEISVISNTSIARQFTRRLRSTYEKCFLKLKNGFRKVLRPFTMDMLIFFGLNNLEIKRKLSYDSFRGSYYSSFG